MSAEKNTNDNPNIEPVTPDLSNTYHPHAMVYHLFDQLIAAAPSEKVKKVLTETKLHFTEKAVKLNLKKMNSGTV